MGYADAWAALNGEMPAVIPRTEYSAEGHRPLVSAATGIEIHYESPAQLQAEAQRAFLRTWDYGLRWNILVQRQYIKGRSSSMGHAVYAAGGVDRDDHVYCPFKDPEEVLAYDPQEAGSYALPDLVAAFEQDHAEQCASYDDCVNMSGVYITMFSGLIEIFGWDMLLLAAGIDPERFGEMVQRYERWVTPFFQAYAETDIPVMMAHDDICWSSGPVLRPDWYRRYIFPAYRRLWAPVLESGKRLIYTSDGKYDMFFDDIVEAGAHCLVMEPMSDMAAFAERYGRTHGFIGNADTRVLLSGSREQIRAEVERCMAIGRDCPGFIMAVGNHIPANTPVENALYYNQVFEELRRR